MSSTRSFIADEPRSGRCVCDASVPGQHGEHRDGIASLNRFAVDGIRTSDPIDLGGPRISWESPANVLEKNMRYEAVHAISSWEALRRRVAPEDCRCFAFFHPATPDEPLILVEVALPRASRVPCRYCYRTSARPLPPTPADTAIFYSIFRRIT